MISPKKAWGNKSGNGPKISIIGSVEVSRLFLSLVPDIIHDQQNKQRKVYPRPVAKSKFHYPFKMVDIEKKRTRVHIEY